MTQVDEAFKKDQFALRMAHMQEHMEKGLYDPENFPESPMPGIHYQIREFLARVKDRVGKVKSVGAKVTVDEFVIAGIGGGVAAGVLQTSLGRRFAVVVAQVTGTIGVGAQIMGGWYEFDVKTHKLIGFASGGGAATGGIGDNHSGVSGGLLVAGLTVDRGGNTNIIEGGVSTLHVAKEIGFMPVKLLPMLPKHRGIRQHGKYDFIKEQLGLI
jgi:hypothetical protein